MSLHQFHYPEPGLNQDEELVMSNVISFPQPNRTRASILIHRLGRGSVT